MGTRGVAGTGIGPLLMIAAAGTPTTGVKEGVDPGDLSLRG